MKVVIGAVGLALVAGSIAPSNAARPSSDVCRGPGKIIVGTRGADGLKGTEGRDTICGLGGQDTIVGLGGNDLILGGPGDDRISGGPGRDTIDGGPGVDLAGYRDSPTAVRVNLVHGTVFGGDGRDRLRSIEEVAGSAHEDTLRGSSSADGLYGRGGEDNLQGRAGNDRLDGGDGNDLIGPGPGRDEINGGAGTDVFDFRAVAHALRIDLNRGLSAGRPGRRGPRPVSQSLSAEGVDFYVRMEGALGSRFADDLRGAELACRVEGGAWFEGGAGDDRLRGTTCADLLDGGPGTDRLDGWTNYPLSRPIDRCLNGEVVVRC